MRNSTPHYYVLFLPLVSSVLYANEALSQPIIRRAGVFIYYILRDPPHPRTTLQTAQGDVILGTGNCPLHDQTGSD